MEAVTHFNNSPEERSLKSFAQREFHTLSVKQSHAQPDENSEEKNDSTKQDQLPWDLTNEGYVNDEPNTDSPINLNFYQKVQKFEGNQRPIKIIKRPVGKPVRVPVPPPLPSSDSFAC